MEVKIHPPSPEFVKNAHVDAQKYEEWYARSVSDPDGFWGEHARRLDWIKPFTKVKNTSFAPGNISIRWFEDGTLNVAANCIDRHLEKRGDQVAIIWEPDEPGDPVRNVTYRELHDQVSRMANVLKAQGVKKGDRVVIYMPMIPEAAFAMLACARIGAIHSVVFAGFSPDACARKPHQRLRREGADHRRRGPARRAPGRRGAMWIFSTRCSRPAPIARPRR